MTEGFRFSELNGLRRLAKSQRIHIRNLCDVISLYKFGIQENPWNKLDAGKIRNANFQRRVKGQDAAITKTLDVVKRAMTGLSGVRSSSSSRPKGALFFAGPTGTGKKESEEDSGMETGKNTIPLSGHICSAFSKKALQYFARARIMANKDMSKYLENYLYQPVPKTRNTGRFL